jgi:hypothetical protein
MTSSVSSSNSSSTTGASSLTRYQRFQQDLDNAATEFQSLMKEYLEKLNHIKTHSKIDFVQHVCDYMVTNVDYHKTG